MAFAVVSNRAPLAAGLLKNLRLAMPCSSFLGPASVATTHRRLYSTGGAPFPFPFPFHRAYYYETIGDELVLYHHHQLPHPIFHHPFFTTTITTERRWRVTKQDEARRWWVSKQDEDAVEVTVAMPGIPAERVKVWANKKGLFVKEDVKGNCPDDVVVEDPDRYSCHIELCADAFDLEKAEAEMKYGLLTVTVPRVKGYLKEIKVVNAE